MVKLVYDGSLTSSFIVMVGLGAMTLIPLVWLVMLLTCGLRHREPELETPPGAPFPPPDDRTASKELALLIVGALEQSDIVPADRFNDAVRIAVDKIQLRMALEDPSPSLSRLFPSTLPQSGRC